MPSQQGGNDVIQIPPGFEVFLLEGMEGLNTQAKRPGIKDQQFAWVENFIPIGPSNLRAMWGAAPAIYSAPTGLTIIAEFFYNVGFTNYGLAFLDDGSGVQFNLDNGSTTTVGAAGTFWAPTGIPPPAVVQWSNKGILIVSNVSANAYWAWDGTTLFSPGGPAPTWLSGLDAPITLTGDTNSSTNITNVTPDPTVSSVQIGMTITSNTGDIPASTLVTAMTSTTLDISNAATASNTGDTLTLDWSMPTGIAGSAIEIFLSRVWITNGTLRLTSVASNGADFSVGNGGVAAPNTDSSLRTTYTALKAANGYLYYFGDSECAYVTNVVTDTNSITTYQYTVIDPQIGTPWRDSVIPFGRSILFANSNGVYALYGSSANKISDALDGVWNDTVADFATTVFQPTSAVQTIFGIKVFMICFRATPFGETAMRQLIALFDGKKWFMASQGPPPIRVAPQEVNSHLNAYGTDGSTIYNLFDVASSSLTKTVISKLWGGKYGYLSRKQAMRFYMEAEALDDTSLDVSVVLDNESPGSTVLLPQPLTFVNSSSGTLQFINNGAGSLFFQANPLPSVFISFTADLVFINAGGGVLQFQNNSFGDLFFQTPTTISYNDLSGSGLLLGFTLTSTSPDFVLLSAGIGYIAKTLLY